MYIQLCNIDDCHSNDYDAFGKRRDRIGCCGVTALAAVAMVMAGS